MKKFLRKFIRFFLFSLLGIFISINLFILLSGRFYLYKGVANTYLKGQSGPSIYDLDVFPYSTIKKNGKIEKWDVHPKFNTQKIPADYREYMEELGTTAFLVFKNDTLLYEEYWDGHTQETVSNSFSIAKTLVAMLVGIAVDEGYIKSIDESASNYIPEFKKGGREVITIRHLLEMSSGLSWEESSKNPLSDNAESYYGSDLHGLSTRQKLISKPGEKFIYQSGNSQLLAYIVEKATGKDLSEYAREKLWSKLGMEHDAYWSLDRKGGDEKAFCCVYATARDFARIGKMMLHYGNYDGQQIVPDSYYFEMIKPAKMKTEEGIDNYQYGLHLWTYFGLKNPVYYCRGIKGQYIITIPEEKLLIIRLGKDRKETFQIPDHLKGDKEYFEENKYNVGHALCMFQYINLGKIIVSQTNFNK